MRFCKYLCFLGIISLFTSCATSAVFEDYKYSLVHSDHAVSGTIIDKIDLYDTYTPYRTRYIFAVDKQIKGKTKSDTIHLLTYSGKTGPDSFVDRTFDWQYEIGDQRILIMNPIVQETDSIMIKINELNDGVYLVDYNIPDQYAVMERIIFEKGKTRYTKPKVSMSKMVRLMKKWVSDPNKVVPKAVMKI